MLYQLWNFTLICSVLLMLYFLVLRSNGLDDRGVTSDAQTVINERRKTIALLMSADASGAPLLAQYWWRVQAHDAPPASEVDAVPVFERGAISDGAWLERRDVARLDKFVLGHFLQTKQDVWRVGLGFDVWGALNANVDNIADAFVTRARAIFDSLLQSAETVLLVYSTRLALLAPFWMHAIKHLFDRQHDVVCVIVFREPFDQANDMSLRRYHASFNASFWLLMWSKYYCTIFVVGPHVVMRTR
jgi:hypothetical protein